MIASHPHYNKNRGAQQILFIFLRSSLSIVRIKSFSDILLIEASLSILMKG